MRQPTGICLVLALALLGATPAARSQTGEAWPQPNAESLPAGAFKETVLYGRKLFNETYSVIGPEVRDTSMRYSGNNLSCQSCHLQGGMQRFAIPMIGVYGIFPLYIAREDEVRTLEERIQGCMERSMNGRTLAARRQGDEGAARLCAVPQHGRAGGKIARGARLACPSSVVARRRSETRRGRLSGELRGLPSA